MTQKRVNVGFLLVLLVVLANFLMAYRAYQKLAQITDQVTHTHETILTSKLLLESLLNAETGARGYIISATPLFLAPYEVSIQTVLPHLARLEAIADDETTQGLLPSLTPLIKRKLNYMEKAVQDVKAGDLQAGQAAVNRGTGKQLMDEIRVLLERIETQQITLRQEALRQREAQRQRLLTTLLLGTLLTLIFIGIAYAFYRREAKLVAAAQTALEESNQLLESRVQQRTDELRQANQELERSNRELQDFAFVASHDLQEPLRKVQAFGDLLKTDYGQQLGAEGIDFIERMQNSSRRMDRLIQDLLAFSRVTTKAQPFLPTDLNQVAAEVLEDLEARLKQTGGTVQLGNLPTIDADALQMRQLLQNLIGNALKFHRAGVAPVITITSDSTAKLTDPTATNATARDGATSAPSATCQLAVADNGIGFDEKYLDRIFTPFQRLHGKNEYEGTGMGLAICRKVVERHGGTLTARSRPGEGSTFLITLPYHHAAPAFSIQADETGSDQHDIHFRSITQ